jgi:hypothetical protein
LILRKSIKVQKTKMLWNIANSIGTYKNIIEYCDVIWTFATVKSPIDADKASNTIQLFPNGIAYIT